MSVLQASCDLQRALQADYVLVFSTDEDWAGPNNQATFRLLKLDENNGEGRVEEIDLSPDDVHSIVTQASQPE